eukprot:CAMPEP_0118634078 /NCGR_PEP_ID=MMETSP0785-20121206/1345_1 /TAXON_ID=91992 /ORGANISM="Bolidomonas pacifica, Strain CCMP 1866" /LENGTH=149 /DNA_ID=CAMNT_0006525009 /DNA_START=489 /DNA_END=935 /DNA_ORIENTATION=+
MTDDVDLGTMRDFMYSMLRDASYTTNPISPAGSMTAIVRGGLERFMKVGAYERCKGRLKVVVTEVNGLRGGDKFVKRVWSEWGSDEELVDCIMASCYVPIYYECPTMLEGKLCLDGGLVDNLPSEPDYIRVCPYAKEAEIGNNKGAGLP